VSEGVYRSAMMAMVQPRKKKDNVFFSPLFLAALVAAVGMATSNYWDWDMIFGYIYISIDIYNTYMICVYIFIHTYIYHDSTG